jgi:Ran GTPase-activating protein (RanGAP) involved in mRNA processing and transport
MIMLDVSNNNLLDDGGVSILLAIGDDPEELMLGNQDDVNVNTSLTSLNISSNELGIKSADAIGKVFRNNPYLTALNIDNNPNLPKLEMKNAMETMRLCNLSMEQLSSSYNTQSVRSFFHIMRLLEYPEPPIKRLTLSKCRIGPGHLTHAKKCLMNAKTVEKLDLSMNELGDEGMEQLYLAFSGITSARMHEEEDEENSTGFGFASSTDSLSKASMHQYHKIQHLDISCCSFSKSGASNVFRMVTSLNHLSYLDMSENNIGPDCMTENIEHIISCRLRVLKLNRCQLKSKGAKVLLDIMSNSFRKNERPPFFYDAKIARRDSRLLKRSGLDNPRLAALAIDLMENHDTYDILRPEVMSMASRSTDDNEVLHEISMPALIVRPIDRNELSEDSSNHILSQRADVHLDMNQSEESSIANKINLLYDSLQVLTLADNDICDSITPSLTKLLETNMTLEYLDLGFNKFSSHAMEMVKPALRVSSESILEKKINSLYVNLVGNENCEDYMLETPGLTRSKITLNYNSKSLALNKLNRPLQSKNDNTNKQFHLIPDYRNVIS